MVAVLFLLPARLSFPSLLRLYRRWRWSSSSSSISSGFIVHPELLRLPRSRRRQPPLYMGCHLLSSLQLEPIMISSWQERFLVLRDCYSISISFRWIPVPPQARLAPQFVLSFRLVPTLLQPSLLLMLGSHLSGQAPWAKCRFQLVFQLFLIQIQYLVPSQPLHWLPPPPPLSVQATFLIWLLTKSCDRSEHSKSSYSDSSRVRFALPHRTSIYWNSWTRSLSCCALLETCQLWYPISTFSYCDTLWHEERVDFLLPRTTAYWCTLGSTTCLSEASSALLLAHDVSWRQAFRPGLPKLSRSELCSGSTCWSTSSCYPHTWFVWAYPTSLHRNRNILVLTDVFSRWVEAYPLPDQTAESTAVCLADRTTPYGSPLLLYSDRGTSFLNAIIAAFCRIWHIQQHFTSAHHPQANGLVERFNATLCDMLRAYSVDTGQLWDETMNAVLFAYRTSFHLGINTSPDLLVYGQSLRVPLYVELYRYLRENDICHIDPSFIFSHAQALYRARNQARLFMHKYKAQYESQYNARHRTAVFNVGDIVWLQTPHRHDKLSPKWSGPFRIYISSPFRKRFYSSYSWRRCFAFPCFCSTSQASSLRYIDYWSLSSSLRRFYFLFSFFAYKYRCFHFVIFRFLTRSSATNNLTLSSPLPSSMSIREFLPRSTDSVVSDSEREYAV